jgi:UDP-N-acetylmuramoyl-tripeptide--D-alanyl-D-alanine ligase
VNSWKYAERRLKKWIAERVKEPVEFELARGYRRVLDRVWNVCFIGITGSCGKTTTVELLAAILAREGRVGKCCHVNTAPSMAKTILTLTPRHRFCVSEISGDCPGAMDRPLKLLRPRLAVVTHVGHDHHTNFRSLAATAVEKGKLVEALPPDGVAALNADDPHVYAMRERTKARVITYGLSAEVAVRGENVACAWPSPMSMDICHREQRYRLQTRLFGEHWAYSVLAALAAALAAGVALERALAVVETFGPVLYRLSPHPTPSGVTFISDTWKAPLWTVPASLNFLKTAQAERKIAVFGSISDTPRNFEDRYRIVVRHGLATADKLLFVGEHSDAALRLRPHPDDDRILAFSSLRQLDSFLTGYLRPGDLVLLKGSENADHLYRLVLARTGGIACWQEKCGKLRYCRDCRHLQTPSGPPIPPGESGTPHTSVPHGA